MAKLKQGNVEDLIDDDKNANRGNEHGQELIEQSIETLGLGRSVLVDRDNILIAGNKTRRGARKNGVQKTIVIETDGTELIVVKRTDLSIDDDKGRALALADNRTAEANLNWDPGNLELHFEAVTNMGLAGMVFDLGYTPVSDEDLNGLFTGREKKEPDDENEDDGDSWGNGGSVPPFSLVLTYTETDFEKVKAAISQIGGTPEKVLFDLLGLDDEN